MVTFAVTQAPQAAFAPRRVAPVSCICFCEAGVQARGFSHAYHVRGASGIVFPCNVCWPRLVCRALHPGLVTRTACLKPGGMLLWGPSFTGTSSYGVGLRPKVSTRVGAPCRRRCIVCLSVLRDGPCSRTRLKPLSGGFVSRWGLTGVMSSTTGSGPGFAVRAGRLVARMTYRSTCSSCWAWSFRRGFSWFCVLNDRRRGVTAFCCGGITKPPCSGCGAVAVGLNRGPMP